jgi:hypothetical protein
VISILLIYFAYQEIKCNKTESFSVIAASLAVLTAIISSYSSIKIIENEEDKNRPNIIINIDCLSRYGLVQYLIRNNGNSLAQDIQIEWCKENNPENTDPKIWSKLNNKHINVLMPNEELHIPISGHIQLFDVNRKQLYKGTIKYKDINKKEIKEIFILDFDKYKDTLLGSDEINKMGFELQKLPEILGKIENSVRKYTETQRDYIEAKSEYRRYIHKKYR